MESEDDEPLARRFNSRLCLLSTRTQGSAFCQRALKALPLAELARQLTEGSIPEWRVKSGEWRCCAADAAVQFPTLLSKETQYSENIYFEPKNRLRAKHPQTANRNNIFIRVDNLSCDGYNICEKGTATSG